MYSQGSIEERHQTTFFFLIPSRGCPIDPKAARGPFQKMPPNMLSVFAALRMAHVEESYYCDLKISYK